jgi:hypothetical protein
MGFRSIVFKNSVYPQKMESIDQYGSFLQDTSALLPILVNEPSFHHRYIEEFTLHSIKQATLTDLRTWQLFLQSQNHNSSDDLEMVS